jgi:2,4-dienoyl-CoA reductase-like NADH-dependent reductase (Old Yellow Enzyme family)
LKIVASAKVSFAMSLSVFSKVRINGLVLKNRFVRSATFEALATNDGCVTPSLTKTYTTLADGEVGLIISSCTLVDPHGRHHPTMLSMLSDDSQTSIGRLASNVHKHRCPFAVQLVHAGSLAKPQLTGTPVETPNTMNHSDIDRVVANFVRAARMAFSIGVDAVQVHASGPYLLAQFLSPNLNHRSDAFGGTQAKRTEVVRRIISDIRRAVMKTQPLLVKINGTVAVDDLVQTAKICADAGADAIEVLDHQSGGSSRLRAIRRCVGVPLISSGGFRELEHMEEVVREGVCDLVSLSRPLIRQPDLVALFRQGKVKVAQCIGCSGCLAWTSMRENPLRCVAKSR